MISLPDGYVLSTEKSRLDAHHRLQGLRRFLLATADAHELYRRHGGFAPLTVPERWMERLGASPT